MTIEREPLYVQLCDRLLADDNLDDEVMNLIDAALLGDEALERAIDGTGPGTIRANSRPTSAPQNPARFFLEEIAVQGFRGVSRLSRLKLPPGPGLCLVVGRNGTGKSTFAEGLETLLAGTSQRWEGRAADWQKGWRNLGHVGPSDITCTFVGEALGRFKASRTWAEDAAAVSDSTFSLEAKQDQADNLQLQLATRDTSPFLSYRELAKMVDSPAQAFDALHQVLGLELVAEAQVRLDMLAKQLREDDKAFKASTGKVIETARAIDDPRARRIEELLSEKKPKVAELSAVLESGTATEKDDETIRLRRLSQLPELPKAEWEQLTQELAEVRRDYEQAASGAAEQSATLIGLLEESLQALARTPGTCPVCERPLPPNAREGISGRIEQARKQTEAYRTAKEALTHVLRKIATFVAQIPATAADDARAAGLSDKLDGAITEIPAISVETAREVSQWLADSAPVLLNELDMIRELAVGQLRQRDTAFRPLAAGLHSWLDASEQASQRKQLAKSVKAGSTWLKAAAADLRTARFSPLRDQALENWKVLGADSHVELMGVDLRGVKNRRHVDLPVRVDGHLTSAASVLSQGEINCMALSLFLPRAQLANGPFGFVVIDDPVQAMDHVRVDGLARVLHQASVELQVIVFTHDSRLIDAVRRLQLAATILEVHRAPGSIVEAVPSVTPIERYMKNARSVLLAKGVGSELPHRVVPGFCRLAIEAACTEVTFRRRLGRGEAVHEVERALENASLLQLAALALFDDRDRAGDVLSFLNGQRRTNEATALQNCKRGSHGKLSGGLDDLVRWSERFARSLLESP